MNNLKILALIPSRGGSKRIANKNFRPFAGTTLTDLAIRHCLGARGITDTVLTTDSKEVMAIGERYAEIFVLERPAALAQDESPAIDYVRHSLVIMEKNKGYRYDMVVIIQPTSPLRTPHDIDSTIKLLADHPEADSSVSIVKLSHMVHPLKLKVMHGHELSPFIDDEGGRFSANELPDVYVRNCAVYVTWRKELETRRDVMGKRSLGFVMPPETSVDINDMIDFEFAEYLYSRQMPSGYKKIQNNE